MAGFLFPIPASHGNHLWAGFRSNTTWLASMIPDPRPWCQGGYLIFTHRNQEVVKQVIYYGRRGYYSKTDPAALTLITGFSLNKAHILLICPHFNLVFYLKSMPQPDKIKR